MSVGGKLADISIPDDLILGYSESLQNFNEPIVFASNVEIIGTLSIFETLNGHNHAQICDILQPKPDAQQKLTIKGDDGTGKINNFVNFIEKIAKEFHYENLIERISFINQKCFSGDVIFATQPSIEYLNSEPFQHILLTTWLSNDQYVNFTAGVHFDRAIFHKPITTTVI